MNNKNNKARNGYQNPDIPDYIEEEAGIVPVFTTGIKYSQIPIKLLADTSVSHGAVRLYGIYHNYCCTIKDLDRGPYTWVSQERIARDWLGCGKRYVSKLTKELEQEGWLTPIRQGQGKTNIIILHQCKNEKISPHKLDEYRQATDLDYTYKPNKVQQKVQQPHKDDKRRQSQMPFSGRGMDGVTTEGRPEYDKHSLNRLESPTSGL